VRRGRPTGAEERALTWPPPGQVSTQGCGGGDYCVALPRHRAGLAIGLRRVGRHGAAADALLAAAGTGGGDFGTLRRERRYHFPHPTLFYAENLDMNSK
jgi:hypothetical protein